MGGSVGVDALLANAGYNVRASELAQVAQRLEQLETALVAAREEGISHLSTEAVHYNPSDLAGWIESMLGELNPLGAADDCQLENSHGLAASVSGHIDPCPPTKHWLFENQTELDSVFEEFPDGDFLQEYAALQYSSSDESNMMDFYTGMVLPPADQTSSKEQLLSRNEMEKQSVRMVCPPSATSGVYSELDRNFQSSDDSEQFSYSNGHVPHVQNRIMAQQLPVMMDAQDCADESGLRLVHLLLACAEAVQRNDFLAADKVLSLIQMLAVLQSGPIGRVAAQFAEALARRIYGYQSTDHSSGDSFSELLHLHFYESCPFLRFAHFTANQAILEAFEGQKQVHVIDFNLMHGLQWPALIQALALRPGGPPFLRITGIAPPQAGNHEMVKELGMKLAQLARSVDVDFDFRGVVAGRLNDLKPWMLQVREGEAVAVNSVFQLHRLLNSDNPTKTSIDEVLQCVRSLNPRIVTIVEQEANHNSPNFLERFTEALHYYSTMFDSLEACNLPPQSLQQLLAESYIGKEISNIVGCEGEDRVERHEMLAQWRARMHGAGFHPLHLGSNAFKQARMLLTLFSSREGYVVEENGGCLTLGWHSRPLVAASAWKCSSYIT
ncbi:hypothetical protein O6H91_18G075700 [Diphasiastrum complanatum]|uniref:Uncharacterized protein n=1 Tax=Diphasiastrum complanatum TaxID=34168 RepID=A0ACC2B2Q5_DIPCM|nr:hypothetical protein O6H91_18G075700 [Diphasiastrum complanatum]